MVLHPVDAGVKIRAALTRGLLLFRDTFSLEDDRSHASRHRPAHCIIYVLDRLPSLRALVLTAEGVGLAAGAGDRERAGAPRGLPRRTRPLPSGSP